MILIIYLKALNMCLKDVVAEGLRFELRKELPLCRFSRPVHSTALPSFRGDCFIIIII